ncbi:MAG: hypothetical protein ABR556_11700, partial [Pyrinomonadaceae bacterium]
MRLKQRLSDYESLARPGPYEAPVTDPDYESWSKLGQEKSSRGSEEESTEEWVRKNSSSVPRGALEDVRSGQTAPGWSRHVKSIDLRMESTSSQMKAREDSVTPKPSANHWLLRRGHALTYAALFLFTIILYARPAEFYPSRWTASIAFIVGIIMLAVFVPSQLSLD